MDRQQNKEKFKKRLFKYVIRLVKFLSKLPRDPVIREIVGQLMRSGTSIGANYFEAQGASSKKDYQNFFAYSLKSANESKFWLAVLLAANLIPKQLIVEAKCLLQETTEIASIFASSILTMKGKR